jgi:hypothetical protein
VTLRSRRIQPNARRALYGMCAVVSCTVFVYRRLTERLRAQSLELYRMRVVEHRLARITRAWRFYRLYGSGDCCSLKLARPRLSRPAGQSPEITQLLPAVWRYRSREFECDSPASYYSFDEPSPHSMAFAGRADFVKKSARDRTACHARHPSLDLDYKGRARPQREPECVCH